MMSIRYAYDLVAEHGSIQLLRRSDGKFAVIEFNPRANQVYSIMPGDMPKHDDGARWCANATDAGIDYVSRGYSESYARRVFRKLTTSEEEATW